METGDLTVFKCNNWLSKKHEDGKIVRDLVATVRGKKQLKGRTKIKVVLYQVNIIKWRL